MGISGGFRRLSLVTAIIGTAFLVFCWVYPADPAFRVKFPLNIPTMAEGLLLFAAAPAIVVLLIGWVVAGFQKAD